MKRGNYLKEYTMVKHLALSLIIFVGFGNQLMAMRRFVAVAQRGLVARSIVARGGGVIHVPRSYVSTVPTGETQKISLLRQGCATKDMRDTRSLSVALDKIYTRHVDFLTDPNFKYSDNATVQSIVDDFIEALTVILDDPALVLDVDEFIGFYDKIFHLHRELENFCYGEERNRGLSYYVLTDTCKPLDRLKYLHDERYSVFGNWQADHANHMVCVIKHNFAKKALELFKIHQKTEGLVLCHIYCQQGCRFLKN